MINSLSNNPIHLNSNNLLGKLLEYSHFIFDLWGVVHDGSNIYGNIDLIIKFLKKNNKIVSFLSNAPRRCHEVVKIIEKIGISQDSYSFILTSGEMLFGNKYYYFGPQKDINLLQKLNYQIVNLENANFVLLTGLIEDSNTINGHLKILEEIRNFNLPILCANPDLKVVKKTGEEFACAGALAKYYEKIGGKVIYYGKPFLQTYEKMFSIFQENSSTAISKNSVIAIGDSIETDIKGSFSAGIDNIFVLNGIHAKIFQDYKQDNLENLIHQLLLQHNLPKSSIKFFTNEMLCNF